MTTDPTPQAADPEVLQWYTRARRIPTLIGRLPRGGRLWGGPYTVTQAVGGVTVFLVGQKTMGVWGQFSWVGNWVALFTAAAATLFALRFVKTGGRDPVTALASVLGLGTGPAAGTYEGRPVRLSRSHPVTHRIAAQLGPPVASPPSREPVTPPPAAASASRPAPRPRTAMQTMLAAAQQQQEVR